MNLGFSSSYALRSLRRDGQRTLLGVFCVAVGVMAIVALQLVAASVRIAITTNARAVNQGDLNVGLQASPLQRSDLAFFDGLVANGTLSRYSPIATSSGILQTPAGRRTVSLRAIDTASYPLIGDARVAQPKGQSLAQVLVAPGSAVIADRLAAGLAVQPGQTLKIVLNNGGIVQLLVSGVVSTDSGLWSSNSIAISLASLQQLTGAAPEFQTVVVTATGPRQIQGAGADIRQEFPLANIRSTDDVLQQASKAVDTTRKFLTIIGLLALLIGGVGIMNTEQVLLTRRRTEIVVLKTCGYRRGDLHRLFGIEAALLGLSGGVAGALVGIGVAAAVRAFVIRAFPLILPLVIDWRTVLSGVAVGVATALIFGLLPIVRAAATRPQAVLRGQLEPEASSRIESAALLLILAALFWALVALLLDSAIWAAVLVVGGFVLVGLLGLGFASVLWCVARLPVPERPSLGHTLLVLSFLLSAAALALVPSLRGVAILIAAFGLGGLAIVAVPRSWQISTKLALRNIGRSRARTTTTLVALFVGVFGVGLILVLGQDLKASLRSAITSQLDYNVVAVVPLADQSEIEQLRGSLPGLSGFQTSQFAMASAVAIDQQPVTERLTVAGAAASRRARGQLRLLAGIQGYELQSSHVPNVVQITAGRNLGPTDANSNNVLLADALRQPPLALREGDAITLKKSGGAGTETVTAVGFYRITAAPAGANFSLAPIFGSEPAARALAGGNPFTVFYLNISPSQVNQAVDRLQNQAPDAIVANLDDFLSQFERVLNNILILLTGIASLALIAGLIIVANAVALAMLERRREIGVLKAVGYTGARVLAGVLLENALIAGLGGMLGMAPVSLAIAIFDRQAKVSFGVPAPTVLAIVAGIVVITSVTAAVVAWGAVRVRPLSVLRYE